MKCRHVSHPLSPNSSENNSDSPILSPPILVLNSHLESEKASSAVRTAQLIQLAKLMHGVKEEGGVALVAGETQTSLLCIRRPTITFTASATVILILCHGFVMPIIIDDR